MTKKAKKAKKVLTGGEKRQYNSGVVAKTGLKKRAGSGRNDGRDEARSCYNSGVQTTWYIYLK